MSGKKFLTPEVWEKKISPPPTHTQKSNGQPHKGWGRSLVPRPHFSSRPKRCGPRGPCKNVRAFPARSPRIRNKFTERDWENAVQGLGKVYVIRQENGWRAFITVVVFKTSQDTSGKRKFKRVLRFLFANKRELFAMKLSFEEFNLIYFLHG